MKKRIVSLLFALITTLSLCLQAQTLTSLAPNGEFSSADIEYWLGEGENEAGIILVYDNPDLSPDYFVLGYRWNGDEITLEDALLSISSLDERFYMSSSGGFLDDFAFDYDQDGVYEYSAFTNPNGAYGYFCLKEECISTPVGMSGFYLTGDKWISIEFKSDWNYSEICFAETGEYTPVPTQEEEPLPCLLPTNFHIDFITENSAVAYLGTLAANYTLYLKTENDNFFTSYNITNEVSYTIENLQSGTEYECFIVKDCDDDNHSEESEHVYFTTLSSQEGNCVINNFPYTENFDSYGVTGGGNYPYPNCWTKITTGNIPNINTTKYSGVGGLYLQAAPNTQVVAIMPKIANNIPLNTLSLSFQGKRGSAGNRITVGVMSDNEDESTFDTVFAVSPSSNAWAEYTIDFSDYTGSGKYIAFMCNASRYYIDDVVLTQNEISGDVCDAPTFEIGNITETTADVTLSSNGAEKYIIYLKSLDEDGYTAYETESPSYTLENLNPGTVYLIYAVADCGGENLSDESQSQNQSFTTLVSEVDECSITSLPFEENFDNYGGASGYNSYVYPTCWTLIKDGNFPNINYSSYGGIASLYMNASSTNSVVSASTGQIAENIDINSLKLSFYAKANTSNSKVYVGVMSDAENISTFDTVKTITLSSSDWTFCEVRFNSYYGEGRYVSFLSKANGSTSNSYYIDNVVLEQKSECDYPENISVSLNEENPYSVTLTWTREDWMDVEYTLYYKKASEEEFTEIYVEDWEDGDVVYTLNNLSPNTQYEVMVSKICYDENSATSPVYSFKTNCGTINSFPYEESFEDNMDCWSQEQELGNLSWTAGTQYHFDYLGGEHFAKFYNPNVSGGDVSMLISPKFDFSNAAPNSATLTFSHIQESHAGQDVLTLYYRTSPNEDWVNIQTWVNELTEWQIENIVLPNINGAAEYQLGFEGVTDGGFGIGIDNLTITLDSPQTLCDAPTNFRAMDSWIDDNDAYVFWESQTSSQFVVYYRQQGTETYYEKEVSGDLFTKLENLLAGTTYECYMVAKCSDNDYSQPTQTITFTTTGSTPTDNPTINDENIITWAKGMEIHRSSTVTAGRYFHAIGQANTTDYVAILNGSATATFDRPVTDGEGEDFVVFAHNNGDNGQAWVEVSSDGINFFRFNDKTPILATGEGAAYDLNELEENAALDKNNIRLIRLVDDNIGGYCLAGIGIYNGGEQYLIADFEDEEFLSSENSYEIISEENATRTEEDEDMETTYYFKDNISYGLDFPGTAYFTYGWFMAMGFGPSNAVNIGVTGNGGSYVSPTYYVSSAEAGLEGEGSTYMQSYYSEYDMNMVAHNEVYRTDNSTFYPKGVYVSNSMASYTYSGQTNDYQPGYLKVVATGYNAAGQITNTSEVSIIENGTAFKDWKYLELSNLGEVSKVRFTLESNYSNSYGMLIPSYFCLDNFIYTEGEEPQEPVYVSIEQSICEGDSFMGKTETGVYTIGDTILSLTVNPAYDVTTEASICYGETYDELGFNVNTSNYDNTEQILTFTQNLQTINGCDSLSTLVLTINPTYETFVHDTADYFDASMSLTDTTVQTLSSANGCDSVVTVYYHYSPVGLHSLQSNISVVLYPNPTEANATLTVSGLTEEAAVTVTDQQGRIVKSLTLAKGSESLNIETNNLASGVYYVRIQTANITRTEKLIKR